MSERTEKYYDMAISLSKFYGGKIQVIPKVPVRSLDDFSIWYTPGVAGVSNTIAKDPDKSFELTSRWNTIAIITNGTRVLGLGNIGPEAALPVMEGKAMIFKYLGGVDAFPLVVRAKTKEEVADVAERVSPAFGGINLEDIAQPDCFYLLDRLRETLDIPVWHDDQLGTAAATLAGLVNALKVVGKKLSDVKIVMFGAGAANIAGARLIMAAGGDPKKIILIDSKGALYSEREDMDKLQLVHPWKYELALKTNGEKVAGGLDEAIVGADVLIAASTPGPGVVKKEQVKKMAKDAIVFAEANPVPEIWPWEAKEAGARIVATGRSDFPNQINNSLVFPAVFRGTLDVRAKKILDEMVITAALELAKFAEERGLSEEYIIPTMEEWEVYPRVATAVGLKAIEMGLARIKLSKDEIYDRAYKMIRLSRDTLATLVKNNLISPVPAE
ncbi:NAD(P)-dependent malic enzyme [Conexivisphaera calida]|uniref:NADP-dependent malic enzyme n=1 Tax=Conexivisphaera calida TaxID=1874277 RepID=A0A4P2VE16_9ARCH|nr:NADP-dependent malic enzyme [Conexivisphaera calida]BBE41643.1 NADP-dependent malic enzyme [Conexivisphaera calida]